MTHYSTHTWRTTVVKGYSETQLQNSKHLCTVYRYIWLCTYEASKTRWNKAHAPWGSVSCDSMNLSCFQWINMKVCIYHCIKHKPYCASRMLSSASKPQDYLRCLPWANSGMMNKSVASIRVKTFESIPWSSVALDLHPKLLCILASKEAFLEVLAPLYFGKVFLIFLIFLFGSASRLVWLSYNPVLGGFLNLTNKLSWYGSSTVYPHRSNSFLYLFHSFLESYLLLSFEISTLDLLLFRSSALKNPQQQGILRNLSVKHIRTRVLQEK